MNRGIARRTLFDHAEDMAVFQDQLRAASTRGDLEIHAYSLMGTHYHLLVRSPEGQLASAMQRVQTEYSRWFNRSRKRDGALVRGRYRSKPIESLTYRRAVVAYIDRNPVVARVVAEAEAYPYGSARDYCRPSRFGPGWLERAWVESIVMKSLALSVYAPNRYRDVFAPLPDSISRVVEARWRSRQILDPLDDLVAAAPRRIQSWMKRKARLADGIPPGLPVVGRRALDLAVREVSSSENDEWSIGTRSGWQIIHAGLARELCGARLEEIGELLGGAVSTARSVVRRHRAALLGDRIYAERASRVVDESLAEWRLRARSGTSRGTEVESSGSKKSV